MDRRLAFAIIQELQHQSSESEELEVAVQCLTNQFRLDPNDAAQQAALGASAPLSELFSAGERAIAAQDAELAASPKFQKFLESVTARGAFKNAAEGSPEYKQLYRKVVNKFLQVQGASTAKKMDAVSAVEKASEEADALKLEANDALKAGDLAKAERLYTAAIEKSGTGPNSHLYYCNRAAVRISLKRYAEGAEDCSAAIVLRPDFAKAHSRLARAMLLQDRLEEAEESAKQAVALDPSSAAAKATLDEVKKRGGGSASSQGRAVGGNGSGAGAGGMPDLSALMGALGGGGGSGGGGSGGGMPDLSALMGAMGGSGGGGGGMPDLSALMGAMGGGGGGGMPDLSALMGAVSSNPQLQAMAQNMRNNPQMQEMAANLQRDPAMMQNMMNMLGGSNGGGNGGAGGLDFSSLGMGGRGDGADRK